MRKKIAIALTAGVAAATVGFGAAGTASAAPSEKGACVQEGLGVLKADREVFKQAAQKKFDYAPLGLPTEEMPDNTGQIRLELGASFTSSLGQVVKLHTSNPESFAWCD